MNIKTMLTGKVSVRTLAILGMALLLLMSVAAPVSAGVVPSPWQPQINRLEALVNKLDAIAFHLNVIISGLWAKGAVTGHVADLNKQARQLETCSTHLWDEFSKEAPPPWLSEAAGFVDAVVHVRDAAQRIVDLATIGSTILPDPFLEALDGVRVAAQDIVDQANNYLRKPPPVPTPPNP